MTQLNNEDDIKPQKESSSRHFPLPHKNIPGMTGYKDNKLDP